MEKRTLEAESTASAKAPSEDEPKEHREGQSAHSPRSRVLWGEIGEVGWSTGAQGLGRKDKELARERQALRSSPLGTESQGQALSRLPNH